MATGAACCTGIASTFGDSFESSVVVGVNKVVGGVNKVVVHQSLYLYLHSYDANRLVNLNSELYSPVQLLPLPVHLLPLLVHLMLQFHDVCIDPLFESLLTIPYFRHHSLDHYLIHQSHNENLLNKSW